MDLKERATQMIKDYKKDDYVFGTKCFEQVGGLAAQMGRKVALVSSGFKSPWGVELRARTRKTLGNAGVEILGDVIVGARPNSPFEDTIRIADEVEKRNPDSVVAVGGGSNIDAVKAAIAYYSLRDRHPSLEEYFGAGKVTEMLAKEGRKLLPLTAVQLISGSGSHITKYANITNMELKQKMLMIDDALIPPKALFDYSLTVTMPRDLTLDGGFDGISHCLEVYMGYPENKENFDKLEEICLVGIEIIARNLEETCNSPENIEKREALGLGTDLGGYAIMVGGTNGGHLNSFSLVDILPHGRACALMNPYYLAFFAPAIEKKVRKIGAIYKKLGLMQKDPENLTGMELGNTVANAMLAFCRQLGFPLTLGEVPGFSREHIERALEAAKKPALESKLKNMPIPLSANTVDKYMGAILEAAKTGDLNKIIPYPSN